jgi:hypothetical protein
MYNNDNESVSSNTNSVRTSYRRKNVNNNNYSNNNNNNNYNNNYMNYTPVLPIQQPDSKRVFDTSLQEKPHYYYVKNIKSNRPNDTWGAMMSRTSAEDTIIGSNQRIANNKTYHSSVFPQPEEKDEIKRISRPTQYSNHSTTSQIVALPGCVKRDQNQIKDDYKRYNINNMGHVMKLQKDFNADLVLKEELPYNGYYYKNQESLDDMNNNYIVNSQRFGGVAKKLLETNTIFNPNAKPEIEKPRGRKNFYGQKNLQSQLQLA